MLEVIGNKFFFLAKAKFFSIQSNVNSKLHLRKTKGVKYYRNTVVRV